MNEIRSAASEKETRRLARALGAAGNPYARHLVAERIAAVGTPQAFDLLVQATVDDGLASQACATALSAAGADALPHVMRALMNNPDCGSLAACLPRHVDKDTASRLVGIGKRTVEPWVVRHCAEVVARSGQEHSRALWDAVKRRGSDVLAAAFQIGTIAAFPERSINGLAPFLAADASVEEQKLALSVYEALDLPEGRDCLRRLLEAGLVRDRCYALQVIGAAGLDELGGFVLDAFVDDRSPTVHQVAFDTIPGVASGVARGVPERTERHSEELMQAAAALGERLKSHTTGGRLDECSALLKRIGEAHRALVNDGVAAMLSGADHVTPLLEALPAVHQATESLAPLGEDDEHRDTVWPLIEELLEFQVGRCRDAWCSGYPEARMVGLVLFGLCTIALQEDLPPVPPVAENLTWEQLTASLAGASGRLVDCMMPDRGALSSGPPPELAYPLTGRLLVRRDMQQLVYRAAQCGADAEARALDALGASLERESKARSLVMRDLGGPALADTQRFFDDQSAIFMSAVSNSMRAVMDRHTFRGSSPVSAWVAAARDMLREQALQSALLGIVSLRPSASAIPLLTRCLRSPSSLVAESAEHLLLRQGKKAIPELLGMAGRTKSDVQRARLLEVCRCLDASSAVILARAHLFGESPLLAAVCARTIGEAGDATDASALLAVLGQVDELVDVCALGALGRLDPNSYADVFTAHLASLYPGTQWAAYAALSQCSGEALADAMTPYLATENVYQRTAAEKLLSGERNERVIPQFFGSWFPACSSLWLGARLACRGRGPWEWSIGALIPDPSIDWNVYAGLVGSDGMLADAWIEYSRSGEMPSALTWRLHKIAHEDTEERSELAAAMLWDLDEWALAGAAEACLEYHDFPGGDEQSRTIGKCLQALLRKHAPDDVVQRLEAPNPSLANPLGEGMLVQADGTPEDLLPLGLYLRFVRELPVALAVPELDLPPVSVVADRRAAIAAEWERLMAFQDMTYGFCVRPNLGFADLIWYCRSERGWSDTKRAMMNYVVSVATMLPAFADDREAAQECLRQLFLPLIKKTTKRLDEVWDKVVAYPEIVAMVDREFVETCCRYDPFSAEPTGVHLPFGPLSSTIRGAPEHRQATAGGHDLVQTYVPFAHYLKRRFAQLVREQKAAAARKASAIAEGDEFLAAAEEQRGKRVLTALRAATAGATSDDALISMLTGAESSSGASDAPLPTVELDVDGRQVPCVDIETVADQLGTTAAALRERERRGTVRFQKPGSIRYLPVEELAELKASEPTNEELAAELGVHERTIRRWRNGAPEGLTATQLRAHLQAKAESLVAKRNKGATAKGDE